MGEKKPTVSVVVLTRGKPTLLQSCLENLGPALEGIDNEIVVVEHETEEAQEVVASSGLSARYRRRWDTEEQVQSFSSLNNGGVAGTSGEFILLLNNDVVLKKDTITELLKPMEEKPEVGLVGTKLLFPQGTIQHIGVTFTVYGVPNHLGYQKEDTADYEPANRSDYFDAVTFACVLIRRKVWDDVGGLDEAYHFNYEDVDFCLKAREKGWRCFVNHQAVAYHYESQAGKYRQSFQHGMVRNLKVFRDKWIFNGKLEQLLKVPVQRDFGPLHDERPNIAFIPAGMGAGISWWRIDQVSRKLSEKKLANVQTIHAASGEEKVMSIIDGADLTIWQGHNHAGVKRMAAMGNDRTFRMIYEYDDHPIYMSPFAQAYRVFGTKEESIQAANGDKMWLWRDGENGFDLEANRANRQRQLEIMSLCDAITTTTEPLAAYFRTLNPTVFTLPNCIDFSLYRPASNYFARKKGPIRIGWWGGDNHWHDISMIGPSLVEFVNAHDATLVLLGAYYKGPLRGIDPNKLEDHPWVHVEAFPWRLQAAALDVVVIPLASPNIPGQTFNRFKSDIKWLEASALKLPSLVQGGVEAYKNCIEGETAFTFLTNEEFKAHLEVLCMDPGLRERIGENSYAWAYEHRNLEKEIYRWFEAYQTIIKKQDALRAAESNAVQEGAPFAAEG
jgi:GT2 family glycosyltransferase